MWDELSDFVAKTLSRFPGSSIFASSLVCILLSAGLHNVHFEQDIRRSFSPENSQAGHESRSFLEFHNLSLFPQRAFVVFSAKDGGNVLREEHLDEILRFDRQMTSSLSEIGEDGLRSCHPLCDLNRPFLVVMDEMRKLSRDNSSVLAYPVSEIRTFPVFLGLHVGGGREGEELVNDTLWADSVVLWYFSRVDTEERIRSYENTTVHFFDVSMNGSYSDVVEFTLFSDHIANHEMVRGALEATQLMSIGFVFLLIFVVIVVWSQSPLKMVPFLVAVTLLTPFIATLAAFGLLAWFNYPIYSMQCVTPFLVLGIGVDDAFILMHRWRARSSVRDHASRDHASRLRRVIVDVGPSITITSITNIIAFGVGFFTPTPQMSLFCLSTSIALLLDYILTYTVLAPVVYLCRTDDEQNYQVVGPQEKKEPGWLTKYSLFLCSFYGRLSCALLLCALYIFSSLGVLSMRSTFEPAKAFPSDSPLVGALAGIRPVFDTFYPVNVFVHSPPVISDPKQHDEFFSMVSRLESTPGAYGRNRTQLFLTPYEQFDEMVSSFTSSFFMVDAPYRPSLHNLQYWLDLIGNPTNVHYAKGENFTEGRLTSFSFSLMGQGMAEWANRAEFIDSVRRVLAEYPQFNASLFDCDSAVLSLILTVRNDLIGSIAVTVACMAFICLLFVSSKRGVAIITYTIISICFVLVGCLSWWGADLDPVTQVDVLLATGFSVDYTAHIAYKFFRSSGDISERVRSSLDEMAAPMIQAGLSTFLCMLPLIFVPTYAIVAFAKTIFIVVAVGLVHGLFVLPVLLAASATPDKSPSPTPEVRDSALLPLKMEPPRDSATLNDVDQ